LFFKIVIARGPVFAQVSSLGTKFTSLPGPAGFYTLPMLLSWSALGSLGTILNPAQWLRFYAAKSAQTIKRAAVLQGALMTSIAIFGIATVGIGGRILFPDLEKPDTLFLEVIKTYLPEFASALFLMAVTAAAMSSADSNLHALGAILSKDVFKGLIHKTATEKQQSWVTHASMFGTIMICLGIVIFVRELSMLAVLGLLAMSFVVQILPIVVDLLWFRYGTPFAAACGITTGLLTILLLKFGVGHHFHGVHNGMWGLLMNTTVFLSVSYLTRNKNKNL